MSRSGEQQYDYILVGGGLQSGLLAIALHHRRPLAKVLMIEQSARVCGNHTWSFHEHDVSGLECDWLAWLPVTSWPGYWVHFRGLTQSINLGYCSMESTVLEQRLWEIAAAGQLEIKTNTRITHLEAESVQSAEPTTYYGRTVIDCRGAGATSSAAFLGGFQKFHGFEIHLQQQDWPDQWPTLMDARVDQSAGFRFLYVLPLTPRRVLIEDTYFSDSKDLPPESSFAALGEYLQQRGIQSWSIVRQEQGCLPMPFSTGYAAHRSGAAAGPLGQVSGRLTRRKLGDRAGWIPHTAEPNFKRCLQGGYAGGWFHAATGYSFPLAVRYADQVAVSDPERLRQQLQHLAQSHRFQVRFSCFLNRLLFCLLAPGQRWMIFRRFYRDLPTATIQRFYAHRFTRRDALRILVGSPWNSLWFLIAVTVRWGMTPVRFVKSFFSSQNLNSGGGRYVQLQESGTVGR